MDHHWVGGECNHHYDCCSFPNPGATSPKCVLVIGECVGKKLQNQNMTKAVCLVRNFHTQPCFFFLKCVLSSAVAKSEGGLSCPERTLATNSF